MPTVAAAKPVEIHDVVDFTTYDGDSVDAVVNRVRPSGDSPPSVDLAARFPGLTVPFSNVPHSAVDRPYSWSHKPAKPAVLESPVAPHDTVLFHPLDGPPVDAHVVRVYETVDGVQLDLGVILDGRQVNLSKVRHSTMVDHGYSWSVKP